MRTRWSWNWTSHPNLTTHFLQYMTATAVRTIDLAIRLKLTAMITGSAVAKFAGENVHRRLVNEEAYKQGNYDEALKRAFLGADEEMLASEIASRVTIHPAYQTPPQIRRTLGIHLAVPPLRLSSRRTRFMS